MKEAWPGIGLAYTAFGPSEGVVFVSVRYNDAFVTINSMTGGVAYVSVNPGAGGKAFVSISNVNPVGRCQLCAVNG